MDNRPKNSSRGEGIEVVLTVVLAILVGLVVPIISR